MKFAEGGFAGAPVAPSDWLDRRAEYVDAHTPPYGVPVSETGTYSIVDQGIYSGVERFLLGVGDFDEYPVDSPTYWNLYALNLLFDGVAVLLQCHNCGAALNDAGDGSQLAEWTGATYCPVSRTHRHSTRCRA